MSRVLLIYGGRSPEHEVSIVSARDVFRQLTEAGFETVPVGVARDGSWHVGADSFDKLPEIVATADINEPLLPQQLSALIQTEDVVFPMIHGVTGEDGCLQGFCEWFNIPFVGCGTLSMNLTWDKLATRWALLQAGLPQPAYLPLYKDQFEEAASILQIERTLKYPLFVKPSRTGSSIGVSKVRDKKQLLQAIELAFTFDYRVIVEEGIEGREIEVAALGAVEPVLSEPGELIPENDFYDFEEKYLKNSTTFKVPASLTEAEHETMRYYARKAWSALDCYGMARIDFMVASDGLYLNELNTIPGFTSISMYPRLLAHSGINSSSLMKRLIELAQQRSQHRMRSTAFQSGKDWYRKGSND
jgi:D-alanine-D-alanine ligase